MLTCQRDEPWLLLITRGRAGARSGDGDSVDLVSSCCLNHSVRVNAAGCRAPEAGYYGAGAKRVTEAGHTPLTLKPVG